MLLTSTAVVSDRVCPVNVAEATLDHFFDPHLSSLPRYAVEDLPGAGCSVSQYWCNIKLAMPASRPGLQIRMTRTCDIDASSFDRFAIRASLPRAVTMDVTIVVDGQEARVITGAPGIDDLREYEGGFHGSRLSRIEMTFSRANGSTSAGVVEWTMLASSRRRPLLALDWPRYDSNWGGYLRNDVDGDEIRPDIGFVFDDAELVEIRRKVGSAAYAGVYGELRALAEAHRHDEPERSIGRVNEALTSRYARDAHYGGPGCAATFGEAARVLAFVGLVERDRELLRTAARIALSQAMCGAWRGWLDTHPMSTWEHRAFQQYRTAVACAFALDWAGCMLTDYGKDVITCAIAEKGLAEIQTTFMRHPYVRGNNQGLFFAWGWIVCVLAIEPRRPRAIEWLAQGKEILIETLRTYVLEDGGADEGIGYLTGSLTQALEGLMLYGRRTRTDPADLVPPSVRNVPHYVAANLSTSTPDGTIVPIADGGRIGRPPDRLALAQLWAITRDARAAELYSFLSGWPIDENPRSPGSVFEIIHGPSELQPISLPVDAFSMFPVCGTMSSLRRAGTDHRRMVRLFLVGGKAYGGHSHDDRGSLVVEIDRQEALVDGGQLDYSDPQAEIMKYAIFHNLLTPCSRDRAEVRQLNPCPVATTVHGAGDDRSLDCSIDVTGAWPAPVSHAVRAVRAECLEVFLVDDTMTLTAPGPATQRWNALRPFVGSGEGWELPLDGVTLRILPLWARSAERVEEIGVDGAKRPIYQLQLEAGPGSSHRLTTRFEVVWPA